MAEQVRIDADRGGGTTRRYSSSSIGDQERQDQPVQPKHAGPACAARRAAPRDQITEGSVTFELGQVASQYGRPRNGLKVVRSEGLEPPRCYSLPPQGSASTNSATSARIDGIDRRRLAPG